RSVLLLEAIDRVQTFADRLEFGRVGLDGVGGPSDLNGGVGCFALQRRDRIRQTAQLSAVERDAAERSRSRAERRDGGTFGSGKGIVRLCQRSGDALRVGQILAP